MTKTYHITRKYPAEQYGNFDVGVKGLESREDIAKELAHFDKIAEEYKQIKQEKPVEPFGDRVGERPKESPKGF